MRRAIAVCAALMVLFSCSPRDHTLDGTLSAPQGCATTPQTDCDAAYNQAKKAPSNVTQKQLACAWIGLYLGACHPQPVPVPPSPSVGGSTASGGATAAGGSTQGGSSGSVSKCQLACANLAVLGCPEAQATCPAQCELASKDDRFTLDVDCRINAKTKAQAQKCGIASCK